MLICVYLPLFKGDARADGDANLLTDDFSGYHVPNCKKCGEILKPHVVFFGANVPGAAAKEDTFSTVLLILHSRIFRKCGRTHKIPSEEC